MSKTLHVLVTGATGKQGRAVARELRARGHMVRAFVRNPDSPASRALAELGAELAQGELEDRAALDRAIEGTQALFAMATPFEKGTEAEKRQGVTAAEAAKAAGVHLVYSSVANADQNTGIPHFESKYEVEKHVRAIGVEATILAPAYFMENLYFTTQQLREGVYPSPLSPERALAQVAVSDIAAAAVAALEDPARYAGKRFDLTGDELTGNDTIEILSRVIGRQFSYYQMPMEMIRGTMGEDGVKMYEWFEKVGYQTDRAQLRREFPTVPWLSFEAWARTQDWSFLQG